MLISEINKWHWAISWDNPLPANSSSMLKALGRLGKLTKVQTKTTVVLAPKASVDVAQIRQAIVQNLHPNKGNAFYVNLKSGNARSYSSKTGKWTKAN